MVEVFTKPSVNPGRAKKYIFEKTGMVPAIHKKWNSFCNKSENNVADAQRNI